MPILNSRVSLLLVAPLVTLTFLGAGCGAPSTAIDTETNTITTQNDNGSSFSAGEGAQIPANFPSDFPEYPGGKTILAYIENGGASGSLVQEVSDSLSEVQTKIEQEMQTQGFTKDNVLTDPNVVILTFNKGSIRYQINIVRDAGKTRIQSVRVEQQ